MSITKRPAAVRPVPAEEFISRAPDAPAARKRGRPNAAATGRENRIQIAITIVPTVLDAIDVIAKRKGLSRAAVISLACSELIERDSKN